jgi:hypothetical protein
LAAASGIEERKPIFAHVCCLRRQPGGRLFLHLGRGSGAGRRARAGKGLGADMLSDALRRIAVASQSIGIGVVLVHAKDDAAKRFYMKCAEFIEYPADSRTLFLLIETLVAAFS